MILRSNNRKIQITLLLAFFLVSQSFGQTRTIHVFVALCDNEHQGIVPVPAAIGNGKDPIRNLYWGAGYGVKNYFKNKTTDWILIDLIEPENNVILERLLFKHYTKDIYLLADAYDGEEIKTCVEDFLKASNHQIPMHVKHETKMLNFGGKSNLLAYVGHDGLMDFDVNIDYNEDIERRIDVMILACYSKSYFQNEIKEAQANPVLWTTHLLSPEAYTLKSAIDGWILNETGKEIYERAAKTYHQYQKCGIQGARNLFTTGF